MAPAIRFMAGGSHVVVSTHALFVVLAVVVGTGLGVARAREPSLVLSVAPFAAAAALAGGHVLFRAQHGGPGGLWSGGLSSMGGIVGVAFVIALAARGSPRQRAELADAMAPAGILALAVGRLGCFLGGCCYGRPTELPWGVVFPEIGPPARHPLQLYSAGLDLLLAVALLRGGGPPGAVAAHACLGLGVVRFLLEFLRDPATSDPLGGSGLTLAQGGALILVAGGLMMREKASRRPSLPVPSPPPSPASRRWR
jgi:phosphatidylglycerol:prolipoprotein diacylglycerol transferase